MNKQALVIALGWALQTLTVQAAEAIIQPSDRPKPNAVQTAPRDKASTADRRATAATARRTGIEQGKVREIIEPTDRTGMTRRGKPAPRRDNEKTTPLLPRRPIEDSSVVVPEFTGGDAKAAARERWRALAEEFAFGYVGNFVTKLARPTGEDFEGPAPDLHSCAGPVTPDNRCAATPITRRDR